MTLPTAATIAEWRELADSWMNVIKYASDTEKELAVALRQAADACEWLITRVVLAESDWVRRERAEAAEARIAVIEAERDDLSLRLHNAISECAWRAQP